MSLVPSTLITELARIAAPGPVFAAFQFATPLLLLSAASSSFQAGPDLLKALASGHNTAEPVAGDPACPVRPHQEPLHPPTGECWSSSSAPAALATAAGGNDPRLILFYAVAVFLSFLAGMFAMTRLSYRARQPATLAVNTAGALVVGFTLAVNLGRGAPLVSMAATALILHRLWVRSGRPSGIQQASCQCQATRTAPRLARRGRSNG